MPTPTFEQLVQFREDYVASWNSGDKERFAANWRQFLANDDGFQMFDPVGTPMKRGLVECALDPFDLWQPPSTGPLAEQMNEYLPDGSPNPG